MSEKTALPPTIAPETFRALLAAAEQFAVNEPWELLCDCDAIGLTDPVTGEARLVCVLGNGGEVFGAAIYSGPEGLRWLLNVLNTEDDSLDYESLAIMDALKVEFVTKQELMKEDLNRLKLVGFKPNGKGLVWPQFQSCKPGWPPWFINQAEAEQLLIDLPRLTAFHFLFQKHPDLFDGRAQAEIPFLPNPMPKRALVLEDLDWRPMLAAPEMHDPFEATEQQLAQLLALKRVPELVFEYDCLLMPGGIVMEKGRPVFTRCALLVECRRGLVVGMETYPGHVDLSKTAGLGLVEAILKSGFLPEKLKIDGPRLEAILKPLCESLNIPLLSSEETPFLLEAFDSLSNHMMNGPM